MSYKQMITDHLGFVSKGPYGVLNYWNIQRGKDYAEDCAIGRLYADQLVRFMKEFEEPNVLAKVVKAIPVEPRNGVEIGFFTRLAELLINRI